MYCKPVLFIALRYICNKTINQFNRCIYWVSSIFTILSIIVVIIMLSVMNGFECELKKNLLYLTPHITITSTAKYIHINEIPDFLLKTKFNNIKYFKPVITSNIILQSFKSISAGIMLGVDPNHFEPAFSYLVHNNIHQLISSKYYIIISSVLAQKLSVNILDQVRLVIPSMQYSTPLGFFPIQRICTVLDIYITAYDDIDSYQVLMHKDDAATIMHYPMQCITGWRIWMYEPFKINNFVEHLNISQDWIWMDWRKYKGSLFQSIQLEKNIMFLLLILMISISSSNTAAFLVLLIIEKQKEVAILKTYGFNQIQIMILFIVHGISTNILNVLLGVGLGILVSNNLNEILCYFGMLSKNLYFPVEMQYYQILHVIVWVFIWILLVISYPAWYISSIHPARVLHHG